MVNILLDIKIKKLKKKLKSLIYEEDFRRIVKHLEEEFSYDKLIIKFFLEYFIEKPEISRNFLPLTEVDEKQAYELLFGEHKSKDGKKCIKEDLKIFNEEAKKYSKMLGNM